MLHPPLNIWFKLPQDQDKQFDLIFHNIELDYTSTYRMILPH